MKNSWKVKVLFSGHSIVDKSGMMYQTDTGNSLRIPLVMTAVYNDNKKVLIDTGIHDAGWVTDKVCTTSADYGTIEEILKRELGWAVEDVDIVVNTHLHYDHCGSNKLFKNAKFYLQSREWEHAFKPLPTQEIYYLPELFDARSVNYFNWEFLDGDKEILPGIIAISTPGHTPGHQSVLVNTAEGAVCICGDAANLLRNLKDNIPPNIMSNVDEALNSLQIIRRLARGFILGHDPEMKIGQFNDFPIIYSVNAI
jgi:N-acyl homoserine lactone hydrolase